MKIFYILGFKLYVHLFIFYYGKNTDAKIKSILSFLMQNHYDELQNFVCSSYYQVSIKSYVDFSSVFLPEINTHNIVTTENITYKDVCVNDFHISSSVAHYKLNGILPISHVTYKPSKILQFLLYRISTKEITYFLSNPITVNAFINFPISPAYIRSLLLRLRLSGVVKSIPKLLDQISKTTTILDLDYLTAEEIEGAILYLNHSGFIASRVVGKKVRILCTRWVKE